MQWNVQPRAPIRARTVSTRRALAVGQTAALLAVIASQLSAGPALAAGIDSADFSGGAGAAVVSGMLYAKSGSALILTVSTDAATNCVALTGTHTGSSTTPTGSSSSGKTWSFALNAAAGADGVRTTTITAYDDAGCTSSNTSVDRAYTIDNTAPTVTVTRSPAPNVNGWNNSDITLTWSATDSGSGVASGPTPATDSQTTNTAGTLKTSTATDAVGNVRNASAIVKLDKTPPIVTGNRNPAPNANGWNNTNVTVSFTCSDSLSGIKSCTGPTTFSSNVAGQSVGGSATDFAGNTVSTSVGPINIDKDAPTISGAPVGSPNGAGWYNAEVTIAWTCSDTGGSGFAAGACADSTISGEGTGLTASRSVTDLAGNTSPVATSSPQVNIDGTPPTIAASQSPAANANGWNNTDVTVTFSCADALSGLTLCPPDQLVSSEGADQPVTGTAYDEAGNLASASAFVSIDRTAPSLSGTPSAAPNANGWYSGDVTVTWSCSDDLSGIAGACPPDATLTAEGLDLSASATVLDLAGNSVNASVGGIRIDRTAPSTSATVDAPNESGWYDAPVTVSLSASDNLSGVDATLYAIDGGTSLVYGGAFDVGNGVHTVTFWSRDLAGNLEDQSTTGHSITLRVDTVAPVVAVTGVTAGGTYEEGAYTAGCSSTDDLSGIAASATLGVSGGPTGAVTLACSGAQDVAGNYQAAPVSVTINVIGSTHFSFGGFLRPVAGDGAMNFVMAGSSIPIRFSLGGDMGMAIFAAGSPSSVAYTCGSTSAGAGEPTTTANSGGLTYDTTSEVYSYVWKTDRSWVGCRVLQLEFADGSVAPAYFDFTR